jgi:hypothetical protein
VAELLILQFAFTMVRAKLGALHDDERGVSTLELVLWTAGLAVLALATIVVITNKVNTASNGIPTGPSGGGTP